jgi:hypothetical protein
VGLHRTLLKRIRFRALLIEPRAFTFAERHDNIEAIYKKLQEKRNTASVTELLKELHRIVNETIRAHAPGDDHAEGLNVDLNQTNVQKIAMICCYLRGRIYASPAPVNSDQVTVLPAIRSLAGSTSSRSGNDQRGRSAPSTLSSSWATTNHSTKYAIVSIGETDNITKRSRNFSASMVRLSTGNRGNA